MSVSVSTSNRAGAITPHASSGYLPLRRDGVAITLTTSSSSEGEVVLPSMTEGTTSDSQTENDTPPNSPTIVSLGKEFMAHATLGQPDNVASVKRVPSFRMLLSTGDNDEAGYEAEVEHKKGKVNSFRGQESPQRPALKRPVSLARLRTSSLLIPTEGKKKPLRDRSLFSDDETSLDAGQKTPTSFSLSASYRIKRPPRLDLSEVTLNRSADLKKKLSVLGLGLPSHMTRPTVTPDSSPDASPTTPTPHLHATTLPPPLIPCPIQVDDDQSMRTQPSCPFSPQLMDHPQSTVALGKAPSTPALRPMDTNGLSPISPLDVTLDVCASPDALLDHSLALPRNRPFNQKARPISVRDMFVRNDRKAQKAHLEGTSRSRKSTASAIIPDEESQSIIPNGSPSSLNDSYAESPSKDTSLMVGLNQ